MARSLFEQHGGFATVSKIVMAFYDRVLDSDVIGPYFEDVEMPDLIDHQTKFIASLMGGPASYSDEHLRQIHASLGIDHAAMDEMVRLFRENLQEFGFDDDSIAKLVSELEQRRPIITERR